MRDFRLLATKNLRYFIEQNDYLKVNSETGVVTVVKMPNETEEKTFKVTVSTASFLPHLLI